jgi:hypothetical protein
VGNPDLTYQRRIGVLATLARPVDYPSTGGDNPEQIRGELQNHAPQRR